MGLSIKNEETERLVRELARRKGVGVTTAIRLAVSNELAKAAPSEDLAWEQRWQNIRKIQERSRALPVLDARSDDEILGYDEHGLPT